MGIHGYVCDCRTPLIDQEFDESGDAEKYFQSLLSLVKEGVEKGKVYSSALFRSR